MYFKLLIFNVLLKVYEEWIFFECLFRFFPKKSCLLQQDNCLGPIAGLMSGASDPGIVDCSPGFLGNLYFVNTP